MTTNRRRTYVINKKFQFSVLGWVTAISVFVTLANYLGLSFFFNKMRALAVGAQLNSNHVYFKFLSEQEAIMWKIFMYIAVASAIMIIVGGIFLSHQIAGPLYRLTQHLKSHKKNENVPALKFRKGDYFPEIEEAFNEFIK